MWTATRTGRATTRRSACSRRMASARRGHACAAGRCRPSAARASGRPPSARGAWRRARRQTRSACGYWPSRLHERGLWQEGKETDYLDEDDGAVSEQVSRRQAACGWGVIGPRGLPAGVDDRGRRGVQPRAQARARPVPGRHPRHVRVRQGPGEGAAGAVSGRLSGGHHSPEPARGHAGPAQGRVPPHEGIVQRLRRVPVASPPPPQPCPWPTLWVRLGAA